MVYPSDRGGGKERKKEERRKKERKKVRKKERKRERKNYERARNSIKSFKSFSFIIFTALQRNNHRLEKKFGVFGFFSEIHVGPRRVALVQTVNPSSDSPCHRNSQDLSPYWSSSLPLHF